jgi:hypothetical protein
MPPVNERKPSLRISHIVHGRQGVGNRVKYLVDPKGQGDELKIPEKLVLKRWRQRTFDGYVFKGAKLSSTLWRAWLAAFGRADVAKLSETKVKEKIAETNDERKVRHLKLPEAGAILALAEHCGHARIMTLLERHNSESHQGKSGVPDLSLYAVHTATSKVSIARFVEVKKPYESVRSEQEVELSLLNDLGFHARVFRLIER